MKFWNEFIWYDAKLDHNEIKKKSKKWKKFKILNSLNFWKKYFVILTLNHYFASIYLISSSKSSILHNRHVSTIYVLKVKNVPNLRYATSLTKITIYHRTFIP